jgi:aldehyde dehydrogenase (NAD+)
MRKSTLFYVDGAWVEPVGTERFTVINPATEMPEGEIALGDASDVDAAVKAARRAFPAFARTSVAERVELLEAILVEYKKRRTDLAQAITGEMGAPTALADRLHALMGHVHLKTTIGVLKDYSFTHRRGSTTIVHEPIGVCALITPWNWPINQIAAKVVPALACGCTMVLKPSEYSPFSATIWAEVMHAAGVPAGVFNMIQGTGPTAGAALSAHPEVDMITFTGSTRAGIEVARAAAPTIKRVHQELGGKSANIILPDADLAKAVADGVNAVTSNSGQSCNAPTRMLVPASRMAEASRMAAEAANTVHVGDPQAATMGPVVSRIQFDRIQTLIQAGIDGGATLVAGGTGRPEGLDTGYYVRPTVFGDVTNDMTIAREEIFGPVVSLIGYDDIDQAIEIANDSPYGIAGYVFGTDPAIIHDVASRLRVGQVIVNHATPDPLAPFGGYKQSGNGREWGAHAFEGFLEVKAVLGAPWLETA